MGESEDYSLAAQLKRQEATLSAVRMPPQEGELGSIIAAKSAAISKDDFVRAEELKKQQLELEASELRFESEAAKRAVAALAEGGLCTSNDIALEFSASATLAVWADVKSDLGRMAA